MAKKKVNREALFNAVKRGIKVSLYLVLTILIGVAANPDFKSWLNETPELMKWAGLINVILVVFTGFVRERIPEESKVKQIATDIL